MRIQAAKTNPNSQTFIAPPAVIAPIPHRHIPQFKAKKKTSIIVIIKTDNCDNLETNIVTVISTVKVASNPETKTDADKLDVVLKLCAKAYIQK